MNFILNTFTSLGLFGTMRLVFSYVLSKFFFPNARIVRYPFYIRKEGKLKIQSGFSANAGLVIDIYGKESKLNIGKDVMANYRLHIGVANSIEIGSNTLFGSDCLVIDHSHGGYRGKFNTHPSIAPVKRELVSFPIVIGKNCWFGDRVSVMPGVTIGDGVVVGAGSIVTKDLPSNTLAVGVPARVIKKFSDATLRWEHLDID